MSSGWRRALKLYVAGRNRSLSLQEKEQTVGPAGKPADGRSLVEQAVYGVEVPDTLQYFRNAGTWRDRFGAGHRRERKPGA